MPGSKYCKIHRKEHFRWYKILAARKNQIMWIIPIVIAIVIYFVSINKKDIEEVVEKNVSPLKTDVDTLKTLMKDAIVQLNSLTKQPADPLEYKKNKDTLSSLTNEYKKGQVNDERKKLLDSILSINKAIVKEISQEPFLWSELFPDGYGLFYIGFDKRVQIFWNISNSLISVPRESEKMGEMNKNEIYLSLNITIGGLTLSNSSLQLSRNFSNLNQISFVQPFYQTFHNKILNLYAGIISDNNNGIVGIIGFGDMNKPGKSKQILDYNKLQFAYR